VRAPGLQQQARRVGHPVEQANEITMISPPPATPSDEEPIAAGER